MKPLMLQGHERSITQIRYNTEGDLLFSAGKDHYPNVWYSVNGERLGTFDGHNGTVWCIDVDWLTRRFVSGAGDQTLRLWDCATGKQIGQINTKSSVRSSVFSYSSNLVAYSTDTAMKQHCELNVIDVREADSSLGDSNPIFRMQVPGTKITSTIWGPLDNTIITGHEDGTLTLWDAKMCKIESEVKEHDMQINDMQKSANGTMFITASKDTTAKLFDITDLSVLKTYKTDRPVNSAAISPIFDHVAMGGGQEAMDVTTTATRAGKFETRFFHLIFEEEFARLKGHFGPINTLAFHPDGKSFASGAEDGFVRLQSFDSTYFNYKFDY